MNELLKSLCDLCGASGREDRVRDWILRQVKDHADCRVDALGNLICEKKGEKRAKVKVTVDAHMDEVGLIAMAVNERGFVKFQTVGGIVTETLLAKQVVFENGAVGVIGLKPIHLCDENDKKTMPDEDTFVLDIGAKNRAEALEKIALGETATFRPGYTEMGDKICSKALDDRIGCATLIRLLREPAEYDFTAVFSTREEIGLGGATAAAYSTDPAAAMVLETTTAADLPGNEGADRVTLLGEGVALSLMDKRTLYDKKLYDAAVALSAERGIACQTKQKVAGSNNAGAYHPARGGIRTIALSVPGRYLHSPATVVSAADVEAQYRLAAALLPRMASGEV